MFEAWFSLPENKEGTIAGILWKHNVLKDDVPVVVLTKEEWINLLADPLAQKRGQVGGE